MDKDENNNEANVRADIGRRIEYWRSRVGMSQTELARACGVSPAAVSSWELGKISPTHSNLAKAAEALGIKMRVFWSHDAHQEHP